MEKEDYPVKGEKLFSVLGLLDDNLIQEAEEERPFRKKARLLKYGVVGASAAAALILGAVYLPGNGWWKQLSSGSQPQEAGGGMEAGEEMISEGGVGAGAGGIGHNEGSRFMSYAGPVFPMTLLGEESLGADREIRYDFAFPENDGEDGRLWGAMVTDTYVLYNESAKARKVTALYPFAGSFISLEKELPRVIAEGEKLETVLYAGDYAGKYMGAWGGEDEQSGSINLSMPESWEDYRALLADGDYRLQALGDGQTFDQRVTVYEFTDNHADLDAYPAATQSIRINIEPEKTDILVYGFEGSEWDAESGQYRYSFFVPDGRRNVTHSKLLIVLGDDIGEYELQGFENGGCNEGEELAGVTSKVTRYETDLGTVMMRLIREYMAQYMPEAESFSESKVSLDMLNQAVAGLMYKDGILSADVKERYEDGRLEEMIGETLSSDRVFYLSWDIEIPAHSQKEVQVKLWKEPSYDFAGSGSENAGVQGYDLMTVLDSCLDFRNVRAALDHASNVELVRQNFGFDPTKGVTEVALDPGQEHFYMEVAFPDISQK